jgi:hypothetical protein
MPPSESRISLMMLDPMPDFQKRKMPFVKPVDPMREYEIVCMQSEREKKRKPRYTNKIPYDAFER